MQKLKEFALNSQQWPVVVRIFVIVLPFVLIESFVVFFANRGISSLLLVPGVLASWMLHWKSAFVQMWGLLWKVLLIFQRKFLILFC